MKDMEDELRVLEDQLDAEDDEELFCVACNKEMRNEKAFASHRKQKKHLENVEQLREALLEDELIHSDELVSDDAEYKELDSSGNGVDATPIEDQTDCKSISTPKLEAQVNKKQKCRRKKGSNKKVSTPGEVINKDLGCAVCKHEFPSKNKLFQHLKESGHAVPIS